jgi:hypothetical protein
VRDVHESEIQIDVESIPPPHLPRRTMAAARPETRHIWIFMRNVREALGQGGLPREPLSARASECLTRALARILVHELAHAGEPEAPHAAWGLMAPRLAEGVLTGSRLVLDAGTRRALRRVATVRPEAPDQAMAAASARDDARPRILAASSAAVMPSTSAASNAGRP